MRNKLLIIVLMMTASCSQMMFQRSFVAEMDRVDQNWWTPGRDFDVIPGDSGRASRSREEVMRRTPLMGLNREQSLERHSIQKELASILNALDESTYAQYKRDSAYLGTQTEKIYYLKLSGHEKRDYISTKSISEYKQTRRRPASVLFNYRNPSERELSVGMSKNNVLKAWGRPERVDVAGNPRYENERWSFRENNTAKQVFFDKGKVSGWILD